MTSSGWSAAIAFAAITVLAQLPAGTAKEAWVAPEPDRSLRNPVPKTTESISRGRALYRAKCLACHGSNGEGRGPVARRLRFSAGDLTDAERMRPQPDGELFWKISTGRDPMPAFRKEAALTDAQIWDLINFIRTLASGDPPERETH